MMQMIRSRVLRSMLTMAGLWACSLSASGLDFGQLLQQQANEQLQKQTAEGSAPLIGDASTQQELQLGKEMAGRLLGAAPLVADAKLQRYVNQVGCWLAQQGERKDLPWTFAVLDSETVNAFAAPGGYVFLTKGLYRRLHDENQLAGVLAHEIGHVQQKHQLKVLQQGRQLELANQWLGKQINNDQARQLLGNGAEVFARKLDQNAEFEADRIGVVLAARAGYSPFGLPQVLQGLSDASGNDQVALLFATHPQPEARLTALDAAMADRFDAAEFDRPLAGNAGKRFYRLK